MHLCEHRTWQTDMHITDSQTDEHRDGGMGEGGNINCVRQMNTQTGDRGGG